MTALPSASRSSDRRWRPIDRSCRTSAASRSSRARLALDAPAIARQAAVAAHHAMAGNRHRDRVGAAGLGHGAHRLRRADAPGDLGIARGRARPGSRAAPATRAAGRRCRARRAAGRGPAPALRRSPTTLATSCSKAASPPISGPAETGPAGRAPARRDRRPARIAHTPRSLCATRIEPSEHSPIAKRISVLRAAGAVVGRRHAEHLVRVCVEAAVGVVAGVVDRFGHRVAAREFARARASRGARPRRPWASGR